VYSNKAIFPCKSKVTKALNWDLISHHFPLNVYVQQTHHLNLQILYLIHSLIYIVTHIEAGGLHKFVNRPNRPIITDSGGFQVFSLAYGSVQESLDSEGELKRANSKVNKKSSVKVTEDGVYFRSYRDGKKIFLTPESTVEAQKAYGADIIIPLDQLPPYHIDRQELVDSVNRSHRWEARSLRKHLEDVKEQAMYCVVHGGVDVELRTESVNYLTSLPFDGYAIGGSLGKSSEELMKLLEWMMPMFEEGDRKEKPRHLLGIADENSILGAARFGLDTFDSCYPTRVARHGTFLSRKGRVNIKSGKKYSKAYGIPVDEECGCTTCSHYDLSYLWHLYKAKEPLFMQLAVVHNIHYMNDMMSRLRQDIMDDKI
jgi:queuine tRNA-ribosyltransferase